MDKFEKNDEVIIINYNDLWNNKEGIVIEKSSNDPLSLDLDSILVKVNFGSNENPKYVIQEFPVENVMLKNDNEALVEKLSIDNEKDFLDYYQGKKCKFLGLDYDNIYVRHEQLDGSYDFNPEDLEEINWYNSLTKIPCRIIKCSLHDPYNPDESAEANFASCFWDIEFDNDIKLSGISGENLKLSNNIRVRENLTVKDIIHDYVYTEGLNEKSIPSWYFISKLAEAENISEQAVWKIAKTFNYKLYDLAADNFNKIIVAAPKCKIEDIYNDYADYLQGSPSIKEIN